MTVLELRLAHLRSENEPLETRQHFLRIIYVRILLDRTLRVVDLGEAAILAIKLHDTAQAVETAVAVVGAHAHHLVREERFVSAGEPLFQFLAKAS